MFGSFFGQRGGRDDDEVPKGENVEVDLDVTLEQLYNGDFVELRRVKPVPKEKPGERDCNCRNVMKTQQLSPGRFQMVQQRECQKCANVELVLESSELDVEIEPGMVSGQSIVFHGEVSPCHNRTRQASGGQ